MPRKTSRHFRLALVVRVASMRPRPDAAENRRLPDRPAGLQGGFNEAAARCRGKRRLGFDGFTSPAASMRPRPDAAENEYVSANRACRSAGLQ